MRKISKSPNTPKRKISLTTQTRKSTKKNDEEKENNLQSELIEQTESVAQEDIVEESQEQKNIEQSKSSDESKPDKKVSRKISIKTKKITISKPKKKNTETDLQSQETNDETVQEQKNTKRQTSKKLVTEKMESPISADGKNNSNTDKNKEQSKISADCNQIDDQKEKEIKVEENTESDTSLQTEKISDLKTVQNKKESPVKKLNKKSLNNSKEAKEKNEIEPSSKTEKISDSKKTQNMKEFVKKPSSVNESPEISTDSEKDSDLNNDKCFSDSSSDESDNSLPKQPKKTPKPIVKKESSTRKNIDQGKTADISSESENFVTQNHSSSDSETDSEMLSATKTKNQKHAQAIKKHSSSDSETDSEESIPKKSKNQVRFETSKNQSFSPEADSSDDSDSSDSQDATLKQKQPKRIKNNSYDKSSGQKEENSNQSTVFIKGFGREIAELHVEEEFSKFGKISGIRMPKDRQTGQNKGFCFIDFENPASVAKAIKMNGKIVFDNKIVVDKSERPLGNPKNGFKSNNNSNTLFIKNLSYTANEESIKNLFKKYNPIDIRMPLSEEDSTRNRGYAFIEFSDEEIVQKIRQKTWSLDDKKLYTDTSENKRNNDGRNRDFPDRRGDRNSNDRRGGRDFNDRRGGRDFHNKRGDRGLNSNRDRYSNDKSDFNNRKFSRDDNRNRHKENSNNKKIVFQDSSDE